MRRILLFVLLGAILLFGCQQARQTFICPDGAEVLNKQDCQVHGGVATSVPTVQATTYAPTSTPIPPCPFECCMDSQYQPKACPTDYDCMGNSCKARDSDSDGLPDYLEKQRGTDPLNPNTDGDRYNDAQDPQPTIKNSAKINYTVKAEQQANTALLLTAAAGCLIGACGAGVDPNVALQKYVWTFQFTNTGDDYTQSYSADFIIYNLPQKFNNRAECLAAIAAGAEKTELYRERFTSGTITAGSGFSKQFSYDLTLFNIPQKILKNLLNQGDSTIGVIENEQYEKYA